MGIHIREIKLRMQYVLFSVILTFFCSYFFSEQLIYILATPLEQARSSQNGTPFHFIFTELTEAFFASIIISLFVTLCVLLWIAIYQFWLFIKPGLYFYEKRLFQSFLFLSFFLFPARRPWQPWWCTTQSIELFLNCRCHSCFELLSMTLQKLPS